MRILLTTSELKFPEFEIFDISARKLNYSHKRRFDLGKAALVKDVELMLGETKPEEIDFMTNPNVLLLKDFLRNPRYFLERIFKTWEIEIEDIDNSSLPINFEVKNSRNSSIWVSRQAALAGVTPSDLDVSLELDYLRSPRKFELMIRFVTNIGKIKYEMYSQKEFRMAIDECTVSPVLGNKTCENVEVISGRVITRNNEIIPISNYRTEISVHHAGFLARAENPEFYTVLRTYRDREPLDKAIFVGYSSSWFHFLIECLPRLLSIPSEIRQNTPMILPKNAPRQVLTICESLTNTKAIEVDRLEKIQVQKIYLGIEKGVTDPLEFEFRKAAIKRAINELRSNFTVNNEVTNGRKIYIKRPEGLFRPLQNEKKIISNLIKMGFNVVSPEKMEFQEVLACMANARLIVGESGAALTNILFTLPGAKIIELYPGKGPMTFWPELAAIADAEVEKVMSLRCPIGPRGIARDGIYVPLRKLKKTIKQCENALHSRSKFNDSARFA